MVAHKVAVAVLFILAYSIEASVIAPAVAPISYTRAVPYNVLPFANSVNVFSKTLSAPFVAAYPEIEPAFVRTPLAPIPALAPAFAPAPAIGPEFRPAPAVTLTFGSVPAVAPGLARVPSVIPDVRVSSFLPAPFASAPAVVSGAPAVATPHLAPAPLAPAPLPPAFYANAFNPALGRSLHAVSPAFHNPIAPVLAPAPNW